MRIMDLGFGFVDDFWANMQCINCHAFHTVAWANFTETLVCLCQKGSLASHEHPMCGENINIVDGKCTRTATCQFCPKRVLSCEQ